MPIRPRPHNPSTPTIERRRHFLHSDDRANLFPERERSEFAASRFLGREYSCDL
jgi:hypothetical protein